MRQRALLRAFAVLFAHAVLAASPPAWATPVAEPSTGLQVEVAPAGAAVCRLLPHESPDAPGCAELDVLALERQLSTQAERPSAVVVIRFDDWAMVVTVKGQPGMKLHTAEQIEEFLRDLHQGIAGSAPGPTEPIHGAASGTRYDTLRRNGVDLVRTTVAFAAPPGTPAHGANHMRIYVPVSRTGLAMLSFAGPSEHADTIAAVADGVMETISMTDAGVEGFAQPRDQSLAKLLGVALGAAIPLVASVVALVFAFRRGKKAEPQARP